MLSMPKTAEEMLSRIAAGEEESFPATILNRLLDDETPVKVFWEYCDLTQAELAKMAAISRPYLTQIETGNRQPSLSTLKSLANALRVGMELLIP